MPRPAPKKKPWHPAAGLKIEVGCYRGDVSLKAEATVADAVNVAKLLVAMMRQIGQEAPDTLPFADSVPGAVLPYDWAEDYADGRHASERKRPRLGFRPTGGA